MICRERIAALLVTAVGATVLSPAWVSASAPAAERDCRPSAAQDAAAVVMAKACNARVELESRRSATLQVFANPDGTATIEQSAFPQRGKRADGAWAPLDETLEQRADGTVASRVSAVDLALSGGGSGAFVRVERAGGEVALAWPDKLPKPVLDGTRATYRQVFPGVDLVATARPTGVSFVLVVKDRQAAANPKLRKLTLNSSLKGGLRWDGNRAVTKAGHAAFTAVAPEMWDSSGVRASSVDAPADGARQRPVKFGVDDSGKLTVTPDVRLLTDPDVKFPVYIDPDVGFREWTMINEAAPNQSYWAKDRRDCSGSYNTDCAKVGYYPSGNEGATYSRYRSMFGFATDAWQGKQILEGPGISPRFTIDLLHSYSCTAHTTHLHPIGSTLNSAMNWNNTAGLWRGAVSSPSISTCNYARKYTEFGMSAAAVTGNDLGGAVAFGIRANNEGNTNEWKKFDAYTAKLIVHTNTIPAAPDRLTVDGKACVTGAERPFIATTAPTLRAWASDGDGNTLTLSFERQRIRDDGSAGPILTLQQAGVPSGTQAQVATQYGVLESGDEFVGTGDWDRDGVRDVLGRDPDGYLYLFPGRVVGGKWSVGSRVQLGLGWHAGEYTIAGVADWDNDGFLDIVARAASSGQLFLYPGTATALEARVLLGSGWNEYTFAGLADWDRDGKTDIVARDGGGALWLYPGDGTRNSTGQPRVQLGEGWDEYTFFGATDWDRNGTADIVTTDADGYLWLYPGSGARSRYTGDPQRFEIGEGWQGSTARTIGDVNGDGTVDLVARSSTQEWYAYPGSGGRSYGGERWTIAASGIGGGTYAFRAHASDGSSTGPQSGWCEFTVDAVAPSPAKITADVYKEGTDVCSGGPCGSVGQTGQFTFESSPDVVSFRWGFSDPPTTVAAPASPGVPVTVNWTPYTGGAKALFVTAVDRAGNESRRTYRFMVASPANPVARWKFDDAAGATSIADNSGNGHGLSPKGGVTLGAPGRFVPGAAGGRRTAVQFDGVDDYAERANLLDTSKSFSVSAWVRLTSNGTADQTVIAQAGGELSSFYLKYVATENRWAFTAPSTRTASTAVMWQAWGTSTPRPGVWTHLTGTYDSAAKQLKLYVDGKLEGTANAATLWNSTEAFRVGRAGASYFKGAMAEAQAWPRMITADEAARLADPFAAGPTGDWQFEEVESSQATDWSVFNRPLNLLGGAQMPAADSGYMGTGLLLNGTTAYATTGHQVLRTDQSFTVSVRVRLRDTGRAQTFLAQRGSGPNPGFRLGFDPASGGRWQLSVPASATDAAHDTVASLQAGSPATYHQLVGVVDLQRREIRLHLDGAFSATVALNPAWQAWDATGALLVGTTGTDHFVNGDIDDVRVFQGATGSIKPVMSGTSELLPHQRLIADQELSSPDGRHVLRMQADGDLVYLRDGNRAWESGTAGNPGAYAQMQIDGNFVIYQASEAPLWATSTHQTGADRLVIRNDLGVVLFGPDSQVFWHPAGAPPVGKVIWLRSHSNGKNVVAWADRPNTPLEANTTVLGQWEKFEVIDAGGGRIALRALANGHYVVAYADLGGNPVYANSTILGGWEQFDWVGLDAGAVYLKAAATGGYLLARADEPSAPLRANGIAGAWEKFSWGIYQ
ncbi:LamG-like jellyroll fold domain-containing protein [Micromonospora sp. NPDC000663]|uniref:LamG-like jellyroll fold domain-containing protein n=1 Tax=Micromonospora sp. NPDC000663 TaxID=3364218 RepID=UPI0036AAB73C